MTIYHRTQAFVLQKQDIGEASQYFTLLTKDFGKIKVFAKSTRKIKSKLRSNLSLFYLSEIRFIQGRNQKTIIDTALVKNFDNLGKSLKKTQIAIQMAKVLSDLLKGTEKDEVIWNFYLWSFTKLNSPSLELRHLNSLYYFFLWNLFALLGYSPQLYNCFSCKKKLFPQKFYFSPSDGGIICASCFQKKKKFFEQRIFYIHPDTVKYLRIILKKDWAVLIKLKIDCSCKQSIKTTSSNYLNYLLQKRKM